MSTISIGIIKSQYVYHTFNILTANKAGGIICGGIDTAGLSIYLEPGATMCRVE